MCEYFILITVQLGKSLTNVPLLRVKDSISLKHEQEKRLWSSHIQSYCKIKENNAQNHRVKCIMSFCLLLFKYSACE